MLNWYEKFKIRRIINKYGSEDSVKDLILHVFDLNGVNSNWGEHNFENEYMKIMYSNLWVSDPTGRHSQRVHTYIVHIKDSSGQLTEVYHRTKSDDTVNVEKFRIGYWIYHLYKIKSKKLNMKEIGIEKFEEPEPEEERKILSTIK